MISIHEKQNLQLKSLKKELPIASVTYNDKHMGLGNLCAVVIRDKQLLAVAAQNPPQKGNQVRCPVCRTPATSHGTGPRRPGWGRPPYPQDHHPAVCTGQLAGEMLGLPLLVGRNGQVDLHSRFPS